MHLLLAANSTVESCVMRGDHGADNVIFQAVAYDEDIVCITAVEAHADVIPQFVDLSAAFSLTPCEEKVVHGLLGGRTPMELAGDLGVSINTIRAHLRHCYEKIGVTHREELWQKTYPYLVGWLVKDEAI